MNIKYPFQPKSNKKLLPGMFWGIPLSNGRYACGRVIQVNPRDTRSFLGGLMDWTGDQPPTPDDLQGAQPLAQGEMHIKTITEAGYVGAILDIRPLELEGIEPFLFKSSVIDPKGVDLLKGYEILRKATREECENLKVRTAWGYEFINILAEKLLGSSKIEDLASVNAKILEEGVALEVKEFFEENLVKGHSIEQATKEVLSYFFEEVEDVDDHAVVYLALAELQLQHGELTKTIKEEALNAIESGHDLQRWEEAGTELWSQRKQEFEMLKEKLIQFML